MSVQWSLLSRDPTCCHRQFLDSVGHSYHHAGPHCQSKKYILYCMCVRIQYKKHNTRNLSSIPKNMGPSLETSLIVIPCNTFHILSSKTMSNTMAKRVNTKNKLSSWMVLVTLTPCQKWRSSKGRRVLRIQCIKKYKMYRVPTEFWGQCWEIIFLGESGPMSSNVANIGPNGPRWLAQIGPKN